MDVTGRREDATPEPEVTGRRVVMGHATRPGRLVLTERGNCDGWIASDHVVDLER